MGRAGSGGHSGGRSSGGHSSSRSSGGHRVSSSSRSSSRAGSGSRSSYDGGGSFRSPSHRSTPRCHNYGGGMYHGGPVVHHHYSGGGRTSLVSTIVIIIIMMIIVGSMFSSTSSMGIPKSTYNREKVNTGVAFQNDCIVDEIGWFDNTANTARRLQNFYDETGIQPYIVLKDYDATLTTDAQKDAYAEQYYEDNIDNEGTFLFMYFAEEDVDNDVGYMCYVNGKQITSVMDAEAIDIFWAYMDNKWYSDLSTDDMFVEVFDCTAKRIMSKSTTGADVAKYVVIFVIVVAGGAIAIKMLRMKFKRDKEEAEETERILNTPLNTSSQDDLLDKYNK